MSLTLMATKATDHMPGLVSMYYWMVPPTFKYTKVVG